MSEQKIGVPDFNITGVSEPMPAYVKKIVVDYVQDGPDMFEITFLNQSAEEREIQLFTHQSGKFAGKFKEGDEITVQLGYVGDLTKMIIGEVTSIEAVYHEHYPATFTLRGFNKLHRLSRGKKQRTFMNVKDSDIATQIAGELGLSADVDDSGVVHDHVFQNNLSNIDFLYARARFINFEMDVQENVLSFKRPKVTGGSQLTFKWGTDLKRARFYLSTTQQVEEVQVRGWDPATKQEIIGRASSGDELSKMSGDSIGSDKVGGKFGGGQKINLISNVPLSSQEQADAIAKARFNELAMGLVTGEATVAGNATIKSGSLIEIADAGKMFDGIYYVTSAIHTLKVGEGPGSGFLTRMSFKRSGIKEV